MQIWRSSHVSWSVRSSGPSVVGRARAALSRMRRSGGHVGLRHQPAHVRDEAVEHGQDLSAGPRVAVLDQPRPFAMGAAVTVGAPGRAVTVGDPTRSRSVEARLARASSSWIRPALRLRSAIWTRSPSEPPAMRMAIGATTPSQPNPPIMIIASAAIPARMNADAPDERRPGRAGIHPVGQLQRLVPRRRRDVHRTPRTGGDDRVLELPHPRFRREPRLRLVGRGGHGRQRRRRGVARRVHELAGCRPLPSRLLPSRPLQRLVDAARSPVRSPSGAIGPLPGLADLARLARVERLARRVEWLRVHGAKLRHVGQRRNRARSDGTDAGTWLGSPLHRRVLGIVLDGLRPARVGPTPLPVPPLTDADLHPGPAARPMS